MYITAVLIKYEFLSLFREHRLYLLHCKTGLLCKGFRIIHGTGFINIGLRLSQILLHALSEFILQLFGIIPGRAYFLTDDIVRSLLPVIRIIIIIPLLRFLRNVLLPVRLPGIGDILLRYRGRVLCLLVDKGLMLRFQLHRLLYIFPFPEPQDQLITLIHAFGFLTGFMVELCKLKSPFFLVIPPFILLKYLDALL